MLRAIYKTGSQLFIKNPRDLDLVYYYDTEEEKKQNEYRIKYDLYKL